MGHAACARMLTPSVPVAIEIVSGSTDGEDHKITAVKVRERASDRASERKGRKNRTDLRVLARLCDMPVDGTGNGHRQGGAVVGHDEARSRPASGVR